MTHVIFDAVEGRSDLDLSLNLSPLKTELQGEAGRRFAAVFAESLPICSPGTMPAAETLLRCRPEELSTELVAELIYQSLPVFLDTLPDRYPLQAEPVQIHHQLVNPLWIGFVGSNRLIWAGVILAGITLAFMTASAAIAAENRKKFVYWLGSPLFFPALLMLAAGLWIWISGNTRWWYTAPEAWINSTGYYWALGEIMPEVMRTTLRTIAKGFVTSGAVALALGLGLYLWSRSIPEPGE